MASSAFLKKKGCVTVITSNKLEDLKQIVKLFAAENRFFYIGNDSTAREWGSHYSEAIKSGRAFAVLPRSNILVIDHDTPTGIHQERFDKLLTFLSKNNLVHFTWNSGRDGHQHLVIVSASSESARSLKERIASDFKIPVRLNQAVRPPLSPHRLGLPISSVFTTKEIINALSRKLTGSSFVRHKIPTKAKKLIDSGNFNGDRSLAITKVTLSLVNAKFTDDVIVKILTNPNNGISRHILDNRKTPAECVKYAKFFINKARVFAFQNPAIGLGEEHGDISNFISFAESSKWKGKAGLTDLDVLRACSVAAFRCGSMTFNLSVRELELEARCSIKTVQKSLTRLQEAGWLKKVGRIGWNMATTWQLVLPEQNYHTSFPEGVQGGVVVSPLPSWKQIFRYRLEGMNGLGKAAGRVYDKIEQGMIDPKEIAKATGLSIWTVRRAYKRLIEAGLLTPEGEQQAEVPDYLMEAADLKVEAIRARQVRDRYNFDEYIQSTRMAA